MGKLKVGWFSFTCCEDSTIIFTEMLNDYFEEWKKRIEFRYFRILKKNNIMSDLDVSFVEGAIASYKDASKLRQIRKNSKKLVAIGSCAINGNPSAQRNEFDAKRRKEIANFIKKFRQTPKVRTIEQIVKVDDRVPGCPMTEAAFLKVFNRILEEHEKS